MSADECIRWYSRFFDCVEVNSTYYALPAATTVARWIERTPPRGFLFHVKAYRLMTGHHPRLETLPADLRAMLPEDVPLRRRGEVDRSHFPGEALDRCFELFRGTLDPLAQAGRLGYVLFQLAPWVRRDEPTVAYLGSLSRRLPGLAVAVEFRNETWILEHTDATVRDLADHGLVFVGVDSVWQPYVDAVTAPGWAVVRLHGRNLAGWLAPQAGREPTVAEQYDYLYSPAELREVVARTFALGQKARRVAVTFNNTNNEDFPTQNALDLKRLLGLEAPDLDEARTAWRRRGRATLPKGKKTGRSGGLPLWTTDQR